MAPWWTAPQDRVLRRLYAQGVPVRAIAEQVGRSPDAVSERRRALGIAPRPRSQPWSVAEDELLRAATALGMPASAVAERLRRPEDQVSRRRRALLGGGRPRLAYIPREDEAIAACWACNGNVQALARALGRPAGSLRLRAQKLGLHRPRPRPRWQPWEDAALRDGYERGLTCAQIATELSGRTPGALAARAAKLGLATYARVWTRSEDLELRRLARDGVEIERAAQLLGRTPEALRARSRKLAITPPRSRRAGSRGRRWTNIDDELLTLHNALNPAALADLLDRSPQAVTQRLRRLGLREGAQRSPHHPVAVRGRLTPGERVVVARELRTGGPRRHLALAQRLGLQPADIRRVEAATARPLADASKTLPVTDGDEIAAARRRRNITRNGPGGSSAA